MWKTRTIATLILLAGIAIGFFVYSTETNKDSDFPFHLGLDLAGGTHLVYQADTTNLQGADISDSMQSLRDVIENRINIFGVSEPVVQIEKGGIGNSDDQRLIVELPGVTDIDEAVALIGRTPLLEFKLVDKNYVPSEQEQELGLISTEAFLDTGLTGRLLEKAQLQFGAGGPISTNEPIVLIEFNSEGKDLFAKITRENIGEVLAIFLDGQVLSTPVIQEEIANGGAQISGDFQAEEAKQLVRDLNLGALPVPIELISTQSIGASLGNNIKTGGMLAAIIGIIMVMIFLLIVYRIPGLISVLALAIYALIMLSVFKLVPVVLTAAGIAGFILSIGMAVDANILIFERMKEEIESGTDELELVVKNGFSRAWLSIRDGNISSILTAIILFWFGTSLVKGFALTFGIGVLISMLSAISVSRTLLLALAKRNKKGIGILMLGKK